MGKLGQESAFKSRLVTEICSISSLSNGCIHRHIRSHSSKSSPFIDWYRLLEVEESAGAEVIRKRYHKLALQLHPDKNKHPKSEIAFKLVSEAYECLSNSTKRRAFDLERWRNFCFECNKSNPTNSNNSSKNKASWSKSCRFLGGLKDIRERFREEARVIENCLRTNAASATRKESSSSLFNLPANLFRSNSQRRNYKETPTFNPSDYVFEGYPHVRTRMYKKPDSFWYFQAGHGLNCERGRGKYDSPIFEVRSEREAFRSKSACVHS